MFWKRKKDTEPARTLWLVKDDPEGEWWCNCPQGIVDAPYHDAMTFPAGGTGWLFTCTRCSKAFMFAKAVRIRTTMEQLAVLRTPRVRHVIDATTGQKLEEVLLAAPDDWLELARPMQDALTEGQRYVFFDGRVLPAIHGPIQFQGLWRDHDLPDLPHIAEPPLQNVLDKADYWTSG